MKRTLNLLALSLALAAQSWAATVNFGFNEDPTLTGSFTNYGNANWYPYDGAGYATNTSDGFLEVTAAAGSQRSAIIFQDFDNGAVVQGFTFECDLRIGNGSGDPADGFSISYARAGDPALVAGDNYPTQNPATDGGIFAASPGCEDNLPEEGTKTGIAIGFDAWDSGTGTGCSTIGKDIIGLSIRVDNVLVSQFATPTKNGTCSDATSLQTGPIDAGSPYGSLCWAHLKVDLSVSGILNVYWKDKQILTNYVAAGYFPSPGRLVFAGRTGGNNQNQHVDNIKITTIPAAVAQVGNAASYPDGFAITISDSGSSVVNTNSVTATLNGTAATPLSVTKAGATTTVIYHGFPTLLPVGSTNTVVLAVRDTNNNDVGATRTFVVATYATIPAADAVTGVDTTKPGFRLMPWQSGIQPNQLYWTEEQLIGLHGANDADLTLATDAGYIDVAGVMNFNITPAANGGGDAGSFQTGAGYPDSLFPGIPGANLLNGNSAIEALMFLKFPAAGLYTMVVNSDDGFRVSEGKNPKDRFALRLGEFNGGKGASDVSFPVAVVSAGIYPVRLIWENGNGESGNGANLEWFTIKDGVKYLVNDPSLTNTTGVAAYYAGPQLPAYVSHLFPYNGATGARADKLVAQITAGVTSVNGGSIQLSVDGVPVGTTLSSAGATTTVTANFTPANLMSAGTRTATLVWSDSAGAAHSNNWSFAVSKWVMLNAGLSVPLSAADATAPGFTLQVAQVDASLIGRPTDGMANQVDSANALLGGGYYPWYSTNTVDLSGASGPAPASSNIWYWNSPIDFNIVTSLGDFTYDALLPGIPGVTVDSENIAVWIKGYAAFTNAGYYRMSISSDDGFRVSEGTGITRQVLHVTGPGIDRDVAAVVSSTNNTAFGASLPLVPISGPVVYFPNNGQCPMPATNLVGKIAAINNTTCADREYIAWAQANGAIGVVLINDAQWGLPYVLGGGSPATPITVPVVCVSGFGGEEQMWATAGLTASIGADAQLEIGLADYGKGMGWVDFGFYVPAPGLYPLHAVYMQGGGGAGLEWVTAYSDTLAFDDVRRVIVNDSSTTGSTMAYRAVTMTPTPTISVVKEGGVFKINYTGTLRSAATANGSYQPVVGATSPYTIPTGATPGMFYRSSN